MMSLLLKVVNFIATSLDLIIFLDACSCILSSTTTTHLMLNMSRMSGTTSGKRFVCWENCRSNNIMEGTNFLMASPISLNCFVVQGYWVIGYQKKIYQTLIRKYFNCTCYCLTYTWQKWLVWLYYVVQKFYRNIQGVSKKGKSSIFVISWSNFA